jgi:hypothetical protein
MEDALSGDSGERARLARWRRCLAVADFRSIPDFEFRPSAVVNCFRKVRERGTPWPARETRALPGRETGRVEKKKKS